ncbi:plasmid mobilization relaxosome protein MobC [Bdellovibrionota bacterium FG-1]
MDDTKTDATQPAALPSTHVRFTRDEYQRLRKDQLLTGQSIPWLLKETYFSRADFTPRLDVKTRDAVRRELSHIGNNLNQATRYLHSGMIDDYKGKFDEVYQGFKCLRSFLGIVEP